jgi:hypothetical protein
MRFHERIEAGPAVESNQIMAPRQGFLKFGILRTLDRPFAAK